MIERHVTFNVYSDKKEEFEKVFKEDYRPAMAVMPGFVKVELLYQPDQTSQYQMVIRFDSLETAADWRNSGAHQSLQPKLKALYSDIKLEVYDVIA
jgi:heme-degrading monooxygenase HmoA